MIFGRSVCHVFLVLCRGIGCYVPDLTSEFDPLLEAELFAQLFDLRALQYG